MKKILNFLLIFVLIFFNLANIKAEIISEIMTEELEKKEIKTVEDIEINAGAAVLMEEKTGTVFYSKNPHEKMYPASLTKLLTAMIFLDHFEANETVEVGSEISDVSYDSSKAGHIVGERLSVEGVVKGLIIPSGNDSAAVVARVVAERLDSSLISYAEKETFFAGLMNKKAKELGANNSNFVNPSGYHHENHYSTAYDMAKISQAALKYELIVKIAELSSFEGYRSGRFIETDPSILKYEWKTHNKLLQSDDYYYQKASGLKTGYTKPAGNCLAASAMDEEKDLNLIVIILNSEDPNRWADSIKIFDFGFDNFVNINLAEAKAILKKIDLKGQKKTKYLDLELPLEEDKKFWVNQNELDKVEVNYIWNKDFEILEDGEVFLKAPIKKNDKLADVEYSYNGNIIHKTSVLASKDIEEDTLKDKIVYTFSRVFDFMTSAKSIAVCIIIFASIIIIIYLRRRKN